MRPKPFDVRQLLLFQGLSDEEAVQLRLMFQRAVIASGVRVLQKGLRSQAVYFIVRGSVKICAVEYDRAGTERVVMLGILGAGEVLGEISAIDGFGHSADVITLERSLFLLMPSAHFSACLETMPRLSHNLTILLARRLRFATMHLHSLATQDVGGRVARQLVSFARRYAQPGQEGDILILMRLTQSDLAELVGASRVRVNDVIGSLKRQGVISVDSSYRVTIHDLPALLARCGDLPPQSSSPPWSSPARKFDEGPYAL